MPGLQPCYVRRTHLAATVWACEASYDKSQACLKVTPNSFGPNSFHHLANMYEYLLFWRRRRAQLDRCQPAINPAGARVETVNSLHSHVPCIPVTTL